MMMITFCPSSVTQVVETAPLRASSVRVKSWSLRMYTSPLANASKIELGDLAVIDVLVTRSRPLDFSSDSMLVEVHDDTGGTAGSIQGQDSLDGNIHSGHVE